MNEMFKPALAARAKRHRFTTRNDLTGIIVDSFRLHTFFVLGAAGQVVLSALLPLRWAIVPAGLLLTNSIITTLLQLLNIDGSHFRTGTIDHRVTAQLPHPDGSFGPTAGSGPLTVFRLGVQYNHPLGILSPHTMGVAQRALYMFKDIKHRADELGLYTVSSWKGEDRGSNNTFVTDFYFKNPEAINQFAHEALHQEAWKWWYKIGAPKHVGILHETFVVERYENLYVNCHPVMMGRSTVKCEDKEGDQWVNALVSADTPALRTHAARLQEPESWTYRAPAEKTGL